MNEKEKEALRQKIIYIIHHTVWADIYEDLNGTREAADQIIAEILDIEKQP